MAGTKSRKPRSAFPVGSSRDISDCRERHARLLRSQKLESLGTLAGGIAHDFNNLLGVILGYASCLQASLDGRHPDGRSVEMILRAARRGAQLTRQLLTYARTGSPRLGSVDLHRLIRDGIDLLERHRGRSIRIVDDLDRAAWPVRGDESQLLQVLLNLCTNARDAMPGGGTLTIRTRRVRVGPASVGHPASPRGRCMRIEIADTGAGMKADILARLFEPFFTTKVAGQGTGLGLAVVYGIVRDHGGSIDVDTAPGHGTRWTLLLPAADPRTESVRDPDAPGGGRAAKSLSRPRPSVLVVDDEAEVRTFIADALDHLGYRAVTAASGRKALRLLTAKRRVDAVILDLRMPGLGGRETLKEIRRRRPEIPVLIASGGADGADSHEGLRRQAAGMLPKPFDVDQLREALRRVMGQSLSRSKSRRYRSASSTASSSG